jgi:hypothetical protein
MHPDEILHLILAVVPDPVKCIREVPTRRPCRDTGQVRGERTQPLPCAKDIQYAGPVVLHGHDTQTRGDLAGHAGTASDT